MSMWCLRMRVWRIIPYIIVPHMQKDILSYKGREVPAVRLLYSFASDRNMLIAFLGWMILNLVGRIKISIHFTNLKNIRIRRLLCGANRAFQWHWGCGIVCPSEVEWCLQQSGQQVILGVTQSPDPLVLAWAGWEDWHVSCLEMVRLRRYLINTS